jgi:hypothetical protein
MQLMEIDNRYADMMSRDISQWNPGELRAAYESLKSQVDSTLAAKIDVRLGALAEREKLYNNYARFSQLTAATERRDAELLGMVPPGGIATAPAATMNVVVQTPAGLSAPQMMTQSLAVAPPTVQLGQPTRTPPMSFAASAPSGLPALPAPVSQQAIMQAGGVMPSAGGVMQASGVQPAAANPYSGAGIIQATNLRGAGVPQFMITAADGRFLAFIDSAQDLRPYVGQSMGLMGPRSHQPRLRADLIQVQSMAPVQLAGR